MVHYRTYCSYYSPLQDPVREPQQCALERLLGVMLPLLPLPPPAVPYEEFEVL